PCLSAWVIEPIHCPACPGKVPMVKSHSRRDHKVIIDACPECHGVWLDSGELEAIQQEGLFVALKNFFRWLDET
ncbi:MAG: zf-TFIIB domain-containing protein, partial [Anaerolineae bacterium]